MKVEKSNLLLTISSKPLLPMVKTVSKKPPGSIRTLIPALKIKHEIINHYKMPYRQVKSAERNLFFPSLKYFYRRLFQIRIFYSIVTSTAF